MFRKREIIVITVSNPKVAGFAPRWATFRGFSILFDNPGRSLAQVDNRQEMHCLVDSDPELGFYRSLRACLASLDIDLLTNTYLFCPLPPTAYHVTLWDGCNDGNLPEVLPEQRQEAAAFLGSLPDGIGRTHPLTAMPAASPLVAGADWDIRFRFDQLYKWGNSVLVALLAPADSEAEGVFARLVAERAVLSAHFRQRFGISPSDRYRPHVSLGYFANREAAQLATPCMDAWNRDFAAQMEGQQLLFRRADIYGFTDLGGFFKAAQ